MPYNLATMARQQGIRRNITLRPIMPTAAFATELAQILRIAIAPWIEATPSILAGYDPTPITDSLTRDNASQMTAAIDAAAADFATRLIVDISPRLRAWALRVERWHRTKWATSVRAGTGIDLSGFLTTSAEVDEAIETFVARNVALARDLSAQAEQRISDAVYRGYQSRAPLREVAREIRESTDLGRARAGRIAADQNAKLSGALDLERQVEAGLEQYRWRHSGKKNPRDIHKARDQKLFKLNEPAGDQPGYAPYCGCRAQAWIALVDEVD